MTLQVREARSLPAEEIKALPAAEGYPGAVPADAPRVTRTVSIDTTVPRWHSTGLYAAAGELIGVEIPAAAADSASSSPEAISGFGFASRITTRPSSVSRKSIRP